VVALPAGRAAECGRCGALLYRQRDEGAVERAVALLIGALVLFAVSTAFPILGLEVQGMRNDARLIDSILLIQADNMPGVAGLVFATTVVAPLVEICFLLALLLPLLLGHVPRYLPYMLRVVQTIKPWSMVEVFIVAVLVSLVKLVHIATLIPGLAFWAYFLLIMLLAAASATIDPHDLWHRMEDLERR